MIRNGPVASQFSTKLGAVDYAGDGHSLLGLHANAGITFDVQAIRNQTHYGRLQFSATVGYGGRTVEPSAEFRVLIDGQQVAAGRLGRNDTAAIDLTVQPNQRFLTLISTDGGNGYSHDQISFGDPRLVPADIPSIGDDDRVRLQQLQQQLATAETELAELGEPPVVFRRRCGAAVGCSSARSR